MSESAYPEIRIRETPPEDMYLACRAAVFALANSDFSCGFAIVESGNKTFIVVRGKRGASVRVQRKE